MRVFTGDAGTHEHCSQPSAPRPLFRTLDKKTPDSAAAHPGRNHKSADFDAGVGRQMKGHREVDPTDYRTGETSDVDCLICPAEQSLNTLPHGVGRDPVAEFAAEAGCRRASSGVISRTFGISKSIARNRIALHLFRARGIK
jgi:hypothetical protein